MLSFRLRLNTVQGCIDKAYKLEEMERDDYLESEGESTDSDSSNSNDSFMHNIKFLG